MLDLSIMGGEIQSGVCCARLDIFLTMRQRRFIVTALLQFLGLTLLSSSILKGLSPDLATPSREPGLTRGLANELWTSYPQNGLCRTP